MNSSRSNRIYVPYDTFENHIHCSICLSVIRGAVLTPCGHRYCNRCITEWVGRNHTCPCCNSALTAPQLYCDIQFDGLVDEVLTQRDKAEQDYFDNMFGQATDETSASKSLFEEILKKHMKSSLLSHQRYFDKLREEYQRKIQLLEKGLAANLSVEGMESSDQNSEVLKNTLTTRLNESEQLAAKAFDNYLTENVPGLELLPVNVSVYLADKDVRIPDVVIRPSDRLTAIKPHVDAALRAQGDDIISWSDDSGVRLLFGPLTKHSQYDLSDINNVHKMDNVHQMTWDCQPVFQFHMRPGSEIVLRSVFKAQSDLPKRCFVQIFKESGSQPTDYFSCHTCNVKWICKSCIQCCHTGHDVAPFALNHTPTWACCYCAKKKLCKIQDK